MITFGLSSNLHQTQDLGRPQAKQPGNALQQHSFSNIFVRMPERPSVANSEHL